MLSKNLNYLIYIILFVITLSFILPLHAYAIDEDSVYVWSNNSSTLSTSNTPTEQDSTESNPSQNNSREFFRNYCWKCYINGSKNWKNFIRL